MSNDDEREGDVMYEINNIIKDKLYCRSCKRKTNHKCVSRHIESSITLESPDFQWRDEYYITQCLGCDEPAFYREYGGDDMLEYDEFGKQYYSTMKWVYPEEPVNQSFGVLPEYTKKKLPSCPKPISTLYNQVIDAFNMEHFLLSAVGLRMIVEAICNEVGLTKGPKLNEIGEHEKDKNGKDIVLKNLEGRINALKLEGKVSDTQMYVLHEIRHLGNISAHELKVPEYVIVYKGIEVMEHCLVDIFEHPSLKLVEKD